MRLFSSSLLRPGERVLLRQGAVAVSPEEYAPAAALLAGPDGAAAPEAPPWLLEAYVAAAAFPGQAVADATAAVLARWGVPVRRRAGADGYLVLSAEGSWTGPRPGDFSHGPEVLLRPVPAVRWPYGPPSAHDAGCALPDGGTFCDCRASSAAEEDGEEGV